MATKKTEPKVGELQPKELRAFQKGLKFKAPKKAKPGEWMYAKVASTFTIGGQTYVYGDCVEEWPEVIQHKYRHEIAPKRDLEAEKAKKDEAEKAKE